MKPTNYPLIAFIIFFFIYAFGNCQSTVSEFNAIDNAQQPPPEMCGARIVHERQMKNNPVYRERFLKNRENISKISSQKSSVNTVYKVPVVVHVMHIGEPIGVGSNISDEEVIKGLQVLNNKWRKIQGTNGFGEGVDMGIEFVLAIQDENGQSTTGINRVDLSGEPDYLSDGVYNDTKGLDDYNGDAPINSLKEYSYWDATKYYNIWLVYKIDGKNCDDGGIKTLGYAYYAGAHGAGYDGAIMQACVFANEDSYVSTHELGHAFDLYHTFDGDYDYGTGDYQCPGSYNDGIADTPAHIRSLADNQVYRCNKNDEINTCDASFDQIINPDTGFRRNSGNHEDHVYNYMDYTTCASEFTGGQRAVARNAMENTRTSFLSSSGLDPVAAPVVAFQAASESTCVGNSVQFSDASVNVPKSFTNEGFDNVTFNWTFDNGVDPPYTSTLQNPTVTFNNSGNYDVTLQITNAMGTSSYTENNGMIVNEAPLTACSLSSNRNDKSFDYGVRNVTFNTIDNQTTGYIPPDALEDYSCSHFTTVEEGSTNDLNVSYESIDGKSQFLEVWIDWDNSGTFDELNSNGTNELVLTDNAVSTDPGTHQASESVATPASATSNTLIRMRVISSFNGAPDRCGNKAAQRADDYGIIVGSTLAKQEFEVNTIKLYPNPTNDILKISLKTSSNKITYDVFDIRGQKIFQVISSEKQLNVSNLTAGLYIIKVTTDERVFVGKFLKS
ncbi:T9SS type A sorting domain-containing protein [Gaetbulibacter aestuarii]|uniref:T9SS type A sorting domain-containing protein n=1 Tax=Gaetbulibacter aestuarii TaxID=1502358 RepID=A0ABW7MYM9_9FLAO